MSAPARLAERGAVALRDGLDALRVEVRDLRVRLDRFEAWQATVVAHAVAVSRRLDTPDRDGRLLSAIARAYGGRVFTAADLSSSMDDELRAVLRRVARDDRGAMWTIAIR